ncbi:MAG: hypothetical protein ABSH03_05735 [Candidatus Lustribacter sp.]
MRDEIRKECRIAERRARVEGQRVDETLHRTIFMQHALEDAPAQHGRRILPEVMTRDSLRGFEQQLDLEVGDRRRGRRVGRRRPVLRDQAETFNQTRTSAIN